MVNYNRVVCEVALLAVVVAVVVATPLPCDDKQDKHFDQRQNGSENYRLNIDGVVIAVAPADSLLAAASDIDIGDLLDLDDFNEIQKPKPPQKPVEPKPQSESKPEAEKPQESKPGDAPISINDVGQKKDAAALRKQEKAHRLKNRLANILLPLLRRTRHH